MEWASQAAACAWRNFKAISGGAFFDCDLLVNRPQRARSSFTESSVSRAAVCAGAGGCIGGAFATGVPLPADAGAGVVVSGSVGGMSGGGEVAGSGGVAGSGVPKVATSRIGVAAAVFPSRGGLSARDGAGAAGSGDALTAA